MKIKLVRQIMIQQREAIDQVKMMKIKLVRQMMILLKMVIYQIIVKVRIVKSKNHYKMKVKVVKNILIKIKEILLVL